MEFPKDLKYTKDHEWVRIEEEAAEVGITEYAQEELGDITYLELPEEGDYFSKEDTFGVIESVKTTSDLFTPVSGTVVERNDPLFDSPEMINEDPFGEGWLIRIAMADPSELDELMSADEYEAYIKEEQE